MCSAPIEFLPGFSLLVHGNQAYILNPQLAFAKLEFLGRAGQQIQWVAPRSQLNPYQPLLELKHLKPKNK